MTVVPIPRWKFWQRKLPRPSMGWFFRPTRSFVGNALSVLDEFFDWYYFRWDLWAVPPTYKDDPDHIDYGRKLTRGEADHGKVRGHIAFWIASGLYVYFFLTAKTMPVLVALLAPISLLAYSFGDRIFSKFLTVLPQIVSGWRGKAMADSVEMRPLETPGKAYMGDPMKDGPNG